MLKFLNISNLSIFVNTPDLLSYVKIIIKFMLSRTL